MITNRLVEVPDGAIESFCRKWKIGELALFGSVLREDFRSDSDIDVLATFTPDAKWSLFDHARMRESFSPPRDSGDPQSHLCRLRNATPVIFGTCVKPRVTASNSSELQLMTDSALIA
jgi:predicted nucleotidyltransferase